MYATLGGLGNLLEFVLTGPISEAAERQPPPPSAASRKRMSRQGGPASQRKKLACQVMLVFM